MNSQTTAATGSTPTPPGSFSGQTPAAIEGKLHSARWMAAALFWVALLLFLRHPDACARPQFWAEDGNILFPGARYGGWQSIFAPYPSYYIIAERLAAFLATALPVLYQPAAYVAAAMGCVLLTAWFCLRARLDYLLDARGRAALALALVLAPQNGETILILIGTQWYLMPILVLLILQQQPTRPGQAVVDFAGLLLSGLSGPFIVFFAPFFLVRLRRVTGGWSRYNLALIGAAWSLALLQIWSIHGKLPPQAPLQLTATEWIKELGYRFPGGLFLGAHAPYSLAPLFWIISPLLLGLLGWALWRTERTRFWAAVVLLGCGVATYVGGIRGTPPAMVAMLTPFGFGGRYFYPFYLFAMWMGIVFYHDASERLRRAARVALVLMLLASATAYAQPPAPNLHWEKYAKKLDRGERVNYVPILPLGWRVDYPEKP